MAPRPGYELDFLSKAGEVLLEDRLEKQKSSNKRGGESALWFSIRSNTKGSVRELLYLLKRAIMN